MKSMDVPGREQWDEFQWKVQKHLVEPLGLETVVISVNRHNGQNGNVGVKFPTVRQDHKDRHTHSNQLTVDQLQQEIKIILDDLLQNCTVQFGKIKFVVNGGVLKRTRFSVSARPNESTTSFFAL